VLASAWAEEERFRRINDPWPLAVRWFGPDAGQFDEIGRFFNGLPARRLVILGPAGAGKTALVVKLVRELLQVRQFGDPVPVLLSAATWTDSCTMTEWVTDQLVLDHPGLAVRIRSGTGDTVPLARSLADSEVLPVIDGLDELPEGRRAQVIAEVNAYGSDSPVVLTCRPDEYEAATVSRSVTLASVIKLAPLDLADVRAYLKAATDSPADRWRLVFDTFDADPAGPLAEVLTNPLMLWLARTVYERGTTRPGELADRDQFADRDAIEGHLLAAFIPAAYASRGRKRGFHCSVAQAQRWLSFLAAEQSWVGSQDLAWWRLCLAEPGWSVVVFTVRTVLYTCVAWWAVTWALTRRMYWHDGVHTLHGRFRDLLFAGPLGREVRPLTGPLVRAFLPPGFDSSVDSALRPVVAFGLTRTAAVAAALGLIFGVFKAGLGSAPQTPRLTFAKFRSVVIRRWLWITVLAWAVWASRVHREPIPVIASLWRTQLVLIWIGILTVGWVLTSLAVPVDVSSAVAPRVLLQRTRWVYVLRCVGALTMVAALWLWTGTTIAVAYACVTVAGFVIVAVLGSAAGGAWPRYLEARFRLSFRRRLPWRTMSFLSDAHERGVLRQVGAAYQFRHVRLQEQLAAGYSPWPPRVAPLVAYIRGILTEVWTFVIWVRTLVRGRLADRYVSSQMRHRVLLFPKLPSGADAAPCHCR
jgi:NACHT domain